VAIDGQLFIVLLLTEVRVGCQKFVRVIKIKLLSQFTQQRFGQTVLFIADSLSRAN
jgi:hypothetical protein